MAVAREDKQGKEARRKQASKGKKEAIIMEEI